MTFNPGLEVQSRRPRKTMEDPRTFPTEFVTLDAIHLATALMWREAPEEVLDGT